jgi:hypothetical protein
MLDCGGWWPCRQRWGSWVRGGLVPFYVADEFYVVGRGEPELLVQPHECPVRVGRIED